MFTIANNKNFARSDFEPIHMYARGNRKMVVICAKLAISAYDITTKNLQTRSCVQ
jgi:hypothetical protein